MDPHLRDLPGGLRQAAEQRLAPFMAGEIKATMTMTRYFHMV